MFRSSSTRRFAEAEVMRKFGSTCTCTSTQHLALRMVREVRRGLVSKPKLSTGINPRRGGKVRTYCEATAKRTWHLVHNIRRSCLHTLFQPDSSCYRPAVFANATFCEEGCGWRKSRRHHSLVNPFRPRFLQVWNSAGSGCGSPGDRPDLRRLSTTTWQEARRWAYPWFAGPRERKVSRGVEGLLTSIPVGLWRGGLRRSGC